MIGHERHIDFDEIRAAHPLIPLLEAQGLELKRSGSSGLFVCLCPFHREETPSFTVYPDNHAHCYGCDWHGDVLDFVRDRFGCSDRREAVRRLTGKPLSMFAGGPIRKPTRPEKQVSYRLSDADLRRMECAAHRLAGDEGLIRRLVTARPEWTPEAIRGAALDGDLGFEDGKLLFGYRHGIKARWTNPSGERMIRWLCGGANGECWRQTLLLSSHRLIYFNEGETDALTLLSLEVEEPGKSLILALASASTLPEPKPFLGRTIVILTDPDMAGEQAATKVRLSLEPVAASVVTIPLREIGHGQR